MFYRRFGRTNVQMPVFSCGGMRYQQSWNDQDPFTAESQKNLEACIHRSLEVGINHIETARGYGTSEEQLGHVLPKLPREKLQKLELAVVGLDCKACSFAAYQTVMRLEGVEQCEVLFRETRVTAWVDASKIDKAKIEMALKEKGLKIRMPEEAKK